MADRSSSRVASTPKAFQDRTMGFYLSLASSVLLLIAAAFYLIYSVSVGLFVPMIFVVMLLGVLSELLVIFTDIPHIRLLPVLLAVLSFGLYLDERIEMFVLMASGVYGMSETGAILECVVAILILTALSFLIGLISCFILPRKSTTQADHAAHTAYRQEKQSFTEETLRKEKAILAAADTPITVRMLSGRSKRSLIAGMAGILIVSLLAGGTLGYFSSGGSREDISNAAPPVVVYGISVTRMPSKISYNEGEQFMPDGMTVTIHSSDGRCTEAQGWYTSVDGKALEVGDSEVAVCYQDFSVNIGININEAEVSGIFSGDKHRFRFKENGVVQISDSDNEENSTVGVWRNAGNTVTAVINGEEYSVNQYSGAYYFSYDDENVSTTQFNVDTSFHFEGPSQFGEMAGIASADLSEDGTVLLTQSGHQLAEGTWYKEGQTLYVSLDGKEYTGTYDSATDVYTLLCSASAMGYTFNYTMTNAPASPSETDPEPSVSDSSTVLELTGNGGGSAGGRTATLKLFADHTLTLEWIYVERSHVLASYNGTWEQSAGTVVIHLNESNGSVTDYTCNVDGDTYSFAWTKDNDASDPDYTVVLSGSKSDTGSEPTDSSTVLELTGNGSGSAEGRTATMKLMADNTLTLEWVYVERNYVLGSYNGTWEQSDGTVVIHLTESDGSVTDYTCNVDEDTYSFAWTKDNDTSDPDYTVVLSGNKPGTGSEPANSATVLELTGNGSGSAAGRTATMKLMADHTLTLEWVYVERNYVLGSYNGTWEQSDGAVVIHLNESNGSVTDYTCNVDGNTYSFSWIKDNDSSDPDYTIMLVGSR